MEKKTPLLLDLNNEAYLIEYLGGMTGVIKNKNKNIIGMMRIAQSEVSLAEPNGTVILKTAGKGWFPTNYNLIKDSNGKILGKLLENTLLNPTGDVILKVEEDNDKKSLEIANQEGKKIAEYSSANNSGQSSKDKTDEFVFQVYDLTYDRKVLLGFFLFIYPMFWSVPGGFFG